jgi:hypothetical protein
VRHYRLTAPLDRLNNVVEALIFDGEVFFDDATSATQLGTGASFSDRNKRVTSQRSPSFCPTEEVLGGLFRCAVP